MAQKAQRLKPILAYPNRALAQLYLQINQQLALLKRIKAVLPKELADHTLHCVLNNKKLLVYTDSANWASQLRFHGKTMLNAIEPTTLTPTSTIQIKIINATATTNVKPKTVIPSKTVAYEIHNQSLITTDPQVKHALDKLSTTLARLAGQEITKP
ncbi:MAG: DUF721 domain-containing protein [Methyloglobulus sp.]|nr:DUF721 domain-containing protein [Methyloglobulus sp.]